MAAPEFGVGAITTSCWARQHLSNGASWIQQSEGRRANPLLMPKQCMCISRSAAQLDGLDSLLVALASNPII
jgi:hypothetical protein